MRELTDRAGLLGLVLLVALSTSAYIGPGAGLGAILVVIAVGLALVLIVAGFLWYPVKRALRRRRGEPAMSEAPRGESPD